MPSAAAYARERHRVVPPHLGVSRLSPYLRHRLVLEREVIAAVLAEHPAQAVDKLISEVLWGTYWKGWLEHRPQLWQDYLREIEAERARLSGAEGERLASAEAGRTGIACFDAWARELRDVGYLHNHVRLWFASIWIFTLRLPWPLGAAFFLRHLLDGDPASNTLSWRWVAGLHTRGKHYLARAENIARYTQGQFDPRDALDERAPPLTEPERDLGPRSIPPPAPIDPGLASGLLLTPEDLLPERSALAGERILAVAGGWDLGVSERLGLSAQVEAFSRGAIADALARAGAAFGAPLTRLDETDWLASAEDWACRLGVRQILTLYAPVGVWQERLGELAVRLGGRGIRLGAHRRPWDERLWPGATKGFFQLRSHAERIGLPALLAEESPAQAMA